MKFFFPFLRHDIEQEEFGIHTNRQAFDQLTPKNKCLVRIDINDFAFSGGEFNLTWTVVSLAPVVQYHLQYRQIEVDLFLDLVVIVEVDGDRDDCIDDS